MNSAAAAGWLAELDPGARKEPDWLRDSRAAAAAAFRAGGLPNTRVEEWKYTDIRTLAGRSFGRPGDTAAADIEGERLRDPAAHELLFVGGRHAGRAAAATEPGLSLQPLAAALDADEDFVRGHFGRYADVRRNGFVALNAACSEDGAVVRIADGREIAAPIHLLHAAPAGAAAANPRNLIVLGQNARAVLIESYSGGGENEYFCNAITEIVLGPGAELEHYRLQQEGARAFHIGSSFVQLGRDSHYRSHVLSLGAALARCDLDVRLAGRGAAAELDGLYLAGGRQHVDHHSRIDHLEPHTRSAQNYRGVLDERGRAVFNGKVVVHAGAAGTDARQANANLLLSDAAEADTKPELEIYADDVKCSHGATVGRLDPDMLFYLRSRAVPEATARSLLVFAFAEELVRRISVRTIRERIERRVLGRLPDAGRISEFLQ